MYSYAFDVMSLSQSIKLATSRSLNHETFLVIDMYKIFFNYMNQVINED